MNERVFRVVLICSIIWVYGVFSWVLCCGFVNLMTLVTTLKLHGWFNPLDLFE